MLPFEFVISSGETFAEAMSKVKGGIIDKFGNTSCKIQNLFLVREAQSVIATMGNPTGVGRPQVHIVVVLVDSAVEELALPLLKSLEPVTGYLKGLFDAFAEQMPEIIERMREDNRRSKDQRAGDEMK